jgi:hypothetical protein
MENCIPHSHSKQKLLSCSLRIAGPFYFEFLEKAYEGKVIADVKVSEREGKGDREREGKGMKGNGRCEG